MVRTARVILEGYPHHITQRGNYRQKVFESPKDMEIYLGFVKGYAEEYDLKVLAYCLMSNHVHFIVIPKDKESISAVFNRAHFRYSQYNNKRKKIKGHLWQGRFYSCFIEDSESYLKQAIRYVERNPVRAKMVKKAWDWKWSSAGEHIGKSETVLKIRKVSEYTGITEKQWKKVLEEEDNKYFTEEIRKITNSGRALGDADFIAQMENKLEVLLRVLPTGRPPRKKENEKAK
ncbi:MAG: hypothetical protein A2328_09965 [Bdellovibrionales bacterium RIFOXYB2_FULL_36_6]|nr:MAG: hypothetical protein A2328_09965 [Bdellovibrionales bacterium RIFOXYB2_FULL_36_6]